MAVGKAKRWIIEAKVKRPGRGPIGNDTGTRAKGPRRLGR
jgi:hypothetical protein